MRLAAPVVKWFRPATRKIGFSNPVLDGNSFSQVSFHKRPSKPYVVLFFSTSRDHGYTQVVVSSSQ